MMGRFALYLFALLFALYTAGSAMTQVQTGERAVVRRFGRILEKKPEPGLYIGLPWGMERVDRVPVGLARRITVGFIDQEEKDEDAFPPGQMLTGDHNLVNVQAEIYFRVREVDAGVEKFVLQIDHIDAFVTRAAESALAEWIAGRKVDDVLMRGKIDLPRFLSLELARRLAPYELGIQVEQVSITKLFPPEQVKESFDRVAQAQTNIETVLNKARQDAERKISETAGKKYDYERQAHAYAEEQQHKVKAETDSFQRRLEQYRMLSRTNSDYLNAVWFDEMTRLYGLMREAGRIELLDHYLTSEGLSITQFPLQPKKR